MVTDSIESGMCAEQAVSDAYDTYYTMFSNMEDELFRERAADVADVKTGLARNLLGKEVVDLSVLPENSIVVVARPHPVHDRHDRQGARGRHRHRDGRPHLALRDHRPRPRDPRGPLRPRRLRRTSTTATPSW
jgi:hypothetical protein